MIYVIRAGVEGALKIGYAVDPERRLRQLQTANHQKLHLIKCIPGGKDVEAKIHTDLSAFRLAGEWFNPTPDVLGYITRLGDVFYELDSGKSYLLLWRDSQKSQTESCPFCGLRHLHGPIDGHRSPHCTSKDAIVRAPDGTILYQIDGYIVRTREKKESYFGQHSIHDYFSIVEFVDTHCEVIDFTNAKDLQVEYNYFRTPNKQLYEAYKRFCSANGEIVYSHRRLTQYLKSIGCKQRMSGERYWEGLRLRQIPMPKNLRRTT